MKLNTTIEHSENPGSSIMNRPEKQCSILWTFIILPSYSAIHKHRRRFNERHASTPHLHSFAWRRCLCRGQHNWRRVYGQHDRCACVRSPLHTARRRFPQMRCASDNMDGRPFFVFCVYDLFQWMCASRTERTYTHIGEQSPSQTRNSQYHSFPVGGGALNWPNEWRCRQTDQRRRRTPAVCVRCLFRSHAFGIARCAKRARDTNNRTCETRTIDFALFTERNRLNKHAYMVWWPCRIIAAGYNHKSNCLPYVELTANNVYYSTIQRFNHLFERLYRTYWLLKDHHWRSPLAIK